MKTVSCKVTQLKTMPIKNEHFNFMKMVSCKVTTIEHDNCKLGDVGVWGAIMGVTGGVGHQGCIGGTQGL